MRDVFCFGSTTDSDLLGRVYGQGEKLEHQRQEINHTILCLNLLQRKVNEKEGNVHNVHKHEVAFLPDDIGFHKNLSKLIDAIETHNSPDDIGFYKNLSELIDAIETHNNYIFDKVVYKYNETFEVLADIAQRMQEMDCVHEFPLKNIETKPTPRLSSATALRQAVLDNDKDAFTKAAGVPADTVIDIPGENISFFDMVAKYIEPHREKLLAKSKK